MVRRASVELGVEKFCKVLDIPKGENIKSVVGQLLSCAYQGTSNSSDATFTSAKELAHSLGAQFHQWEIDEEVTSYETKIEKALGRKLTWDQDDIAKQNIQARLLIIWMLPTLNALFY